MPKSSGSKPPQKPRAAAPRARRTDPSPALKLVVPPREPLLTLRKKELVERVCEHSGLKKKDVKPVVEATLKVLGDALQAGNALAIPPLGKARVNKQRGTTGDEVLVVKLRRPPQARPADAGDDPAGTDGN